MKLRNYFFGALACLALASCSSDDDAIDSGQNGQAGEQGYVAVKLVMPGSQTSAWDNTDNGVNYTSGTDDETAVKDITFFIYGSDGNQVQTPITYTHSSGSTYKPSDTSLGDITYPSTGSTPSTPGTIDKFTDITILLKDKTASQIAVVINWPYDASVVKGELTLTQLIDKTGNLNGCGTGGQFVMSNSVYLDNSKKPVYATPIAGHVYYHADLANAEALAKDNPVKIPVERVLARVDFGYESPISYTDNDKITVTYYDGTEQKTKDITIKPYITGWWLHNTANDSYLVKHISDYSWGTTWTNWNDQTNMRSYWANMLSTTHKTYSYGAANMNNKYCYENTDATSHTTLMVAATLMQKTAESPETWSQLDLVQYLNYNFLTKADFMTYIVGYLKDLGYTKDDGSVIDPNCFTFIYNDNKNTTTLDYDWQTKLGIASGVTLKKNGEAATQTTLESDVIIFKYYNKGQTYYFKKIQHNPDVEDTKYGIVRNHLYKVTITGITGLGTPVPNPEDTPPTPPTDPTPDPTPDPTWPTDPTPTDPDPDQPLDPETPTNDHSAIAAQIMILKYRVVEQNIGLDNKQE
ncbi:MAG: Mfa1 family fimbria major subunit [Prevotella sp.]|nr:Mfa1 family fimbria major subunit [Prevotella sp.]